MSPSREVWHDFRAFMARAALPAARSVLRALLRAAAAFTRVIWLWVKIPARILLRWLWKLARGFIVWLITKSPLSEPRRNAHRPLLRLIPWVLIAMGWIAATLTTFASYYASTLPDPKIAGMVKNPPYLTILARNGEFIAERGMRRQYVPYAALPENLIKAVLATEDRRFFYHAGLDPVGLIRAFRANAKSGEIQQGGSTITQQLAKNLFLGSERTFRRKVEEFVLALWLEHKYTKQELLELYLNRVYFGGGNYGIGAAAYHYFGKEPKDLTLAEAALLAGLIKAPSYYSPTAHPERAKARTFEILKRLYDADDISINDVAEALAHPAVIKARPAAPGFGYVADWVSEVVPMLTADTEHNLIVETTIDADLQAAARDAVEKTLRSKGRRARVSQAAAVLMTPDGRIRAMVGGRNHEHSQFNRAVDARRQPGSAFKPFIYLTAMEAGKTPEDKIEDSPIEIDGWRPENFSRTYRGEITLRQALTYSSNLAAVRLLQSIGGANVVETARRLGALSVRNTGPTLALGTAEVSPLEMATAFSVFANGGTAVVPEIVERIKDQSGRVLYERADVERPRVVTARAVSAMNDMLNAVMTEGTGQGAALALHPSAGKTGTSQNFKDAWIVAYTSYYVGCVWLGNDTSLPMRGVTGGSLPADIWNEIMSRAHERLGPRALPGTTLPDAFWQQAAEAQELSTVPVPSRFRKAGEAARAATSPAVEAGNIAFVGGR